MGRILNPTELTATLHCRRLEEFHLGRTTNQLTKKDFRQIVLCIAERFRRFAVRLDCFKLLPFSDQRELLMKNITLYVQYVLAQYFAAKDAAEQGAYSVLSRDFYTITYMRIFTAMIFTFGTVSSSELPETTA